MSQTQLQTNAPQTQTVPFKKKYKIQGMVTSVIIMWLDFIVLYIGLNSGNSTLMAGGLGIMFVAAAIVYYFC